MSNKQLILTKIQVVLMLLESKQQTEDTKDLRSTLDTIKSIVKEIKTLVEDEC